MKNTIFILDDRTERRTIFNNIGLDTGLSISMYKNFTDARSNLLRADPKVVFIEYGLLISKTNYSESKEGIDFANWLVANDKGLSQRKIIIHTLNSNKAVEIKKILPQAYIIPFNKFSRDRGVLFSSGALSKK